jgi:mannose-6-phosphate isomerase-like protein (cupin superfamily)
MTPSYTHFSLEGVKDMAPDFGIQGFEAHFAAEASEAQDTGFSFFRFEPGVHNAMGHKHEKAEEVYVVIEGSGKVKLDDDVVELNRLDAVRVAPEVTRAFSPGPDGMELLAFGPRHQGDGEIVPDWWTE